MSSALTDLCRYPIVQAPMAGGPSCPQLAAAVSEAGGLGFLAAGYRTADGIRDEIDQMRGLTGQPFGVNLFMPQQDRADPAALEAYRNQLAGEAAWYETALGDTGVPGDDGYEDKVAVLLDAPVPVVSFTFGCPSRDTLDAFAAAGTYTVVTVTSPEEARPPSGPGPTPSAPRAPRRAATAPPSRTTRPPRTAAPDCSAWSPRSARPCRYRSSPRAA